MVLAALIPTDLALMRARLLASSPADEPKHSHPVSMPREATEGSGIDTGTRGLHFFLHGLSSNGLSSLRESRGYLRT